MPSILAVYDQPDPLVEVVKRLKNRGYEDLEVYSPAPFADIDDAMMEKPSQVRIFTLIGGLLGAFTGFFITIWMSLDWPIMIGGKPFASIPPYVIISFELTVLFGGLATLIGLLVVGKLPYGKFGVHDPVYSQRFSAEEFGLVVECADRDVAEVDALMRAHSAKEVNLVEA